MEEKTPTNRDKQRGITGRVEEQVQQVTRRVGQQVNNFSPYLILGKIRIAFWVMMGGVIVLSFFTLLNIEAIFSHERKASEDYRLIRQNALMLSSSLTQAFSLLNLYINTSVENHYKDADALLKKEGKKYCDNLLRISSETSSDDRYLKGEIDEIGDRYYSILEAFEQVHSTSSSEKQAVFLQDEILPKVTFIHEHTHDLAEGLSSKSDLELEAVRDKISTLDYEYIIVIIFIALALYFLNYFTRKGFKKNMEILRDRLGKLKEGKLLKDIPYTQDEFNDIYYHLEELNRELAKVKAYTEKVSSGEWSEEHLLFEAQNELGGAFKEMQEGLQKLEQAEKNRRWENQGVADLASVIRIHANRELNILCDKLLDAVVEYTEAVQGGVFVFDDEKKALELVSCFAYGRKKYVEKSIEIGDGLIGESFRDGDRIILTEIPENYLEITSGLGQADPACILIQPLKAQEQVVGVLEIASFRVFEEKHLNLLSRISEVLASTLSSAMSGRRMKQLLEEAELNAQKNSAQEEELRQNTEELMATREQLEKQILRLISELQHRSTIQDKSTIAVLTVSVEGKVLSTNQSAAELMAIKTSGLRDRSFGNFFSGESSLHKQYLKDMQELEFGTYTLTNDNGESFTVYGIVSRVEHDDETVFTFHFARERKRIHVDTQA